MEIIQNKVVRSSNILTFSTKGNHQKRADNQNHWHDDIYEDFIIMFFHVFIVFSFPNTF